MLVDDKGRQTITNDGATVMDVGQTDNVRLCLQRLTFKAP